MRKVMFGFAAIAAGVAMTAGSAMAAFNVPSKAKGLKGEFVTAFQPCETPVPGTTSNPPIVLPGCTVVAENPAGCKFGSKGAGKFGAGVSKTDVKVSASLGGLVDCPDGTSLIVGVDSVVTTEDCTTGDCTLQVPASFPIGSCVVAAGKCSVKGTVEGFLGSTNVFKDGKIVSIQIDGINVLQGGNRAFTAGVRLGPQ